MARTFPSSYACECVDAKHCARLPILFICVRVRGCDCARFPLFSCCARGLNLLALSLTPPRLCKHITQQESHPLSPLAPPLPHKQSGHYFGLPDLYDIDGYSGVSSTGQGLGSYSLMANSWGFDSSQNNPPLLDAWSRIQLGFVSPTVLSQPGTFSATAAALPGSQVYKITQGFPEGEYLLIENRQPLGYETVMPQVY